MEEQLSSSKSAQSETVNSKSKLSLVKKIKKAKGHCEDTPSSSHTQFFKKYRYESSYSRITREEYLGIQESSSRSSKSFRCFPDLDESLPSEKTLHKRTLQKLDKTSRGLHHKFPLGIDKLYINPYLFVRGTEDVNSNTFIGIDGNWTDGCPPAYAWEMARKLEFLLTDSTGLLQVDRINSHLRDFAVTTSAGYRVDIIDSLCVILDVLTETFPKEPSLRAGLVLLLKNMTNAILLNDASDIVTYFDKIRTFIGFLGYLLLRLDQDELFDLVSSAVIWHLSAPDSVRVPGAVRLRHTLIVAGSVLNQTTARILGVVTSHRFPTFLSTALFLACESEENCIEMIKENLLENIFYRFNPYFPERMLPEYDISPTDVQDFNVKLGDSGVYMSTTLSLLLVLVKTLVKKSNDEPKFHLSLPCPDRYSLRCFAWAYRYECRAREHGHQRITLTVIMSALIRFFGDRLLAISNILMPDVMTLSVMSELPSHTDWTSTVRINTSQIDVQFKKLLIHLSVDFLKAFPCNKFMVESQYWLHGLMYLLDPGLCRLRMHWSPALFAELKKTALQALVCTVPLMSPNLAQEYGLIRRLMWYIEWYSERPYELPVLYWCLRLLQVTFYQRKSPTRAISVKDLFDTHGLIILMHLCDTLLAQKTPPVEMSQVIIALTLRLVTTAVSANKRLTCCVYPHIKWPNSTNAMVRKMLDIVLYSLNRHHIISQRWLISLMNFIWQSIIWKTEYRKAFIANNGIYKLLDIITMTQAPVQCITLALVCDAARAGDAVGQLVSWRASFGASSAYPMVVKCGYTIAALLASIFRDECRLTGVRLDENCVVQDLDHPLRSLDIRNELKNPRFRVGKNTTTEVCLAAGDLAGSRMSKVFSLLHLLSEDLEYRVSLADEAYNLYKNIVLSPEDDAILVLCSHYLTAKLNEAWSETVIKSPGLVSNDVDTIEEFKHIGIGWAVEIKRQQDEVIEKYRQKKYEEECSLYSFLGRVRLNIALDALREVRCAARAADRTRTMHTMLYDAVRGHHRRSMFTKKLGAGVLRTYEPPLDDQNITGHYVKVYSIHPKNNTNIINTSTLSST